ncbi:MAG TPA: hypothetical protein VH436_33295 [Vicinamibacterales bacterium]|jgi:hypothetical protein
MTTRARHVDVCLLIFVLAAFAAPTLFAQQDRSAVVIEGRVVDDLFLDVRLTSSVE